MDASDSCARDVGLALGPDASSLSESANPRAPIRSFNSFVAYVRLRGLDGDAPGKSLCKPHGPHRRVFLHPGAAESDDSCGGVGQDVATSSTVGRRNAARNTRFNSHWKPASHQEHAPAN